MLNATIVEVPLAIVPPSNDQCRKTGIRYHGTVAYVLAFYRLGVLAMEDGDHQRGREYLKTFLEHWGDADIDLAQVQDARQRLRAGLEQAN